MDWYTIGFSALLGIVLALVFRFVFVHDVFLNDGD